MPVNDGGSEVELRRRVGSVDLIVSVVIMTPAQQLPHGVRLQQPRYYNLYNKAILAVRQLCLHYK